MFKTLLFLSSAYLGLGAFFSFFVAPTLFRVLDTSQAGKVVEKVFPVYFSIGLAVSLISVIFGNRVNKVYLIVALIAVLIVGAQLFFINPYAHSLKGTDYKMFLKVHGLSMTLNLLHLILVAVLCFILIKKE